MYQYAIQRPVDIWYWAYTVASTVKTWLFWGQWFKYERKDWHWYCRTAQSSMCSARYTCQQEQMGIKERLRIFLKGGDFWRKKWEKLNLDHVCIVNQSYKTLMSLKCFMTKFKTKRMTEWKWEEQKTVDLPPSLANKDTLRKVRDCAIINE